MPQILSDDETNLSPEVNIINKTLFPDKKDTTPGSAFQSIKTSSHNLPTMEMYEPGSSNSAASTLTLNLVNSERKLTPITGTSVSVAQI